MTPQHKNQLTIIVIFAMTIVPFLIALGFKAYPQLLSKGQTNYGQLISPAIPTERSDLSGFDAFSQQNMAELPGHWLIVNVISGAHCSEICLDALLKTKQLRVMLNKELMRTRRIVMVLDTLDAGVAEQLWLKDSLLWRLQLPDQQMQSGVAEKAELFQQLLKETNKLDDVLIQRLIGSENKDYALNSDLIRVTPNLALRNKLLALNNGQLPDGMLLLMDPLGNLMMRYEPGFDPYKVKNDLMHLLKTSQVG